MFRRSAIEKFGYFNAELIQLLDGEYWARLAASNLNNERFRVSVLDLVILQRSSQPAQTAHAIAYEWQRVQALYPKLKFFSVRYFSARVWRRVSRLFRSARRGLTFNGSMPWEPQLY
jgi:hypothetical protein